ncbi:hypothetical protein Sjap_024403 [Stephania japonica]|uniref:Uncharacterized protein n=1 Tax=Stephania japonica TaxID=461633 RepID=A0AAP0EDB4_9MAGN
MKVYGPNLVCNWCDAVMVVCCQPWKYDSFVKGLGNHGLSIGELSESDWPVRKSKCVFSGFEALLSFMHENLVPMEHQFSTCPSREVIVYEEEYYWMARSKKPVTWEETGNTVGLRGGRRGRRPQTASYRKSKESARATNASDVAEVHDETSEVNASATATVGKEIELHKSQVTTAETSSSDSIEEEQDESQEQEADGEDEGDEGENEDQ